MLNMSQISSPDSRSTPTEEKQNPSVAPLVEALRATTKRLELLHYAKIITVDDEIKQGRAALAQATHVPKADAASTLSGEKGTHEQFVGAMANQMMQGD